MKRFLMILLSASLLAGLAACSDNDNGNGVFEVLGERTFSIATEGDTISVMLRSAVDYKVTPESNWCVVIQKQQVGFKIQVNENETIRDRENKITVEAAGHEPVVLTVMQKSGELFFVIDEDERLKSFPINGGTQTVAVRTNLEAYEVTPSDAVTWCTIGTLNQEGFDIEVDENDRIRRQVELTVSAEGMTPVVITVAQSGGQILLNNDFSDTFNHWESDIPDMFTLVDWANRGKTVAVNPAFYTSADFPARGRLLQKVTGLPDGTYMLSCTMTRGGSIGGVGMVAVDIDGNETTYEITVGGFVTQYLPVEVRGGECSVGLYADVTTSMDGRIWFNVDYFTFE